MTTFYIIRHGQTDWNLQGRWQGKADIPLNDTGRNQAQRLARHLHRRGVRFDAIYSSDLLRAWETATLIANKLDITPVPLPALREIDVGAWSGLTRNEVMAQFHDLWERLHSGEDVPRGGNGETFGQLYDRVVGAVEQLVRERPGQTIALVTHGGPARALLLHAARDKVGVLPRPLHVGNTSLSVIACVANDWHIFTVNDMSHLDSAIETVETEETQVDDAERA
ncbi:MAG: histidine phosphatase family protein [Roseiflexus sp.]|nr:histidine phosphatase family protein [Roseiflexus sp.]MDW8148090.1 histidine phosphatase family protein [Roseiflexaceae bacterium]MDW8234750.1 histidine phosphatase family protein [Roseiflexaceae bacterium]